MNATATLTEAQERKLETVAQSRDSRTQPAGRSNGGGRHDCHYLNSRKRRKLLRQHGLRRTIIGTCGIIPLTEGEAEEHRQRVKAQFFAQLEEWEQTPPGELHFLIQGWKFPAAILTIGVVAGFLLGAMYAWVGLAAVLGFGGWLREAINEAADARRLRRQSASRIRAHAKWKIGQDWTCKPGEMLSLLEARNAPTLLKRAVLRIEAAHPAAEFQLEVFDEDPVLRVRHHEPGLPPEQYVLGAFGLPEKFRFH